MSRGWWAVVEYSDWGAACFPLALGVCTGFGGREELVAFMIHIVALGLPRNQRGTGPWINKYGASPAFGFLLALRAYTGAHDVVGMLGGRDYFSLRGRMRTSVCQEAFVAAIGLRCKPCIYVAGWYPAIKRRRALAGMSVRGTRHPSDYNFL